MASSLAQATAEAGGRVASPARHLFTEICRCLPFIARLHKLEEVASVRQLRSIVKAKFQEFKDIKDPRVTDLMIFKAREELEMTEYLEPYSQRNLHVQSKSKQSSFLDNFFNTPYPQIARKP
ncbi:uncharacterized protein HaLaN_29281 [Haematococcus lacustris]|uniref:NADH dehydrogenase [ubiquinone] 1 alpha subcomplex subunit 6 n=1 Tax=Haematococcus lacustris TaxID=44745 RepID=A0A6A0ACF1_HAELA|nr:uncharacterized protein HaLaN_29281 [Haematococcus lacustris]